MNRKFFLTVCLGFALGAGMTAALLSPGHVVEPALRAEPASPPACSPARSIDSQGQAVVTVGQQVGVAVPMLISPPVSAIRKLDSVHIEDRLLELLERPLPQGREVVRNDKEDGGVFTHEQLDDGTTINRTFSARGGLRGEDMVMISGEKVQRAFYDSGKLKALSWLRSDGSRVDVKLGLTGFVEGRLDKLSNGEKVVTKYDEYGNVRQRWRQLKDGRHTPL